MIESRSPADGVAPNENPGGDESSTPPAKDASNSSKHFQSMSDRLHSFYTPGGACSFPERVTSIHISKAPRQRQRWGDEQMLPHTNWGDLFFDLFYVAAAYNLSNIILSDPSREGFLFFIGLFGPIMAEWFTRMYFDSRFSFSDDLFHRVYEVIHLCFLATAVVHIRTVDVMSNPEYPDMFAYSLALTLLSFMDICRNIEIYFFVDGEDAAKNVAKRDFLSQLGQGLFYLAAAVVSGTSYYSSRGSPDTVSGGNADYGDGGQRGLFGRNNNAHMYHEESLCSGIVDVLSSMAKQCGLSTRFLADASDYDSDAYESPKQYGYDDAGTGSTSIPIWLCLGGYMYFQVHFLVMVVFCFPGGGRHKEVSVPMNIDFCIHRLGEWTMLLLGESILSLLIVETSISAEYYVTFYAGIVSVVLLQYLHFRSQPHHADEHAMRRSKNAGMWFSTLMQIYSFALVAVGVSYKMLLYEYTYEEKGGYRLRRLLQYLRATALRHLAGGDGGSKYTAEERQQRVANFFCGSMAVAWVCLDLMTLTHHGFANNMKRCTCQRTKKIKKLAVIFATIRVALIAFIASLGQYVQDPEIIAIVGMVSIVAQVFTRILGDLIYPKEKVEEQGDDEEEEERWPNVTQARAKPADDNKKDEEHGGSTGAEA